MKKSKKYTFGKIWQVTPEQVCDMLDGFTLDEIQILIQQRVFPAALYKAIRPYLVNRAQNKIFDIVNRANGK